MTTKRARGRAAVRAIESEKSSGLRCADCLVPFANDERSAINPAICVTCFNRRATGRLESGNPIALAGYHVCVAPPLPRIDLSSMTAYCADCGQAINRKATRCRACAQVIIMRQRRAKN